MENLKGFLPLYAAAQIFGLLSVAAILFWIFVFGGGLSILSASSEFNWHPLLMTVGMVYLMGNALLTFRILRTVPKNLLKLIHAVLNGVSLVMIVVAVVAVFDSHNRMNYPNFYSIHSWVGLVAIALFLLQGVLGFSAFLFPGFQNPIRAFVLPYHVYFGHVIFVLAIAAALIGLNEKSQFVLGDDYGKLLPNAIILNLTSICFVIFGILVMYLTSTVSYKRHPRPSDNLINKPSSS